MWQIVKNKVVSVALPVSILAIAMMAVLMISILNQGHQVDAQEDRHTLSSLLEKLNQGIETGPDITLHFIQPVAGSIAELNIPFEDMEDGIPRYEIIDIGDDYFCFRDNTPQVRFVFCVPFSNISSISTYEVSQ